MWMTLDQEKVTRTRGLDPLNTPYTHIPHTPNPPGPGGKRKAMGGAVFFACLSVVAESVFELVGSSADDYRRRRALDRLQQPAGAPAAASSSSGGSPTK